MDTQKPYDPEHIQTIISECKVEKWALIPLLQKIQEAIGYIPSEAIKPIARHLKLYPSEVQGVIEFYAGFSMKPKGKHVFKVCRGTACHVKGSRSILSGIEKKLGIKDGETSADYACSLETVACLGACFLAPTMMAGKEYYGKLSLGKIPSIVDHVTGEREDKDT
ncbi:MAG: NAD(P)H-dependent oxidoreductase subunit E [Proteobacteria bacterium]|nr:NAD(P)H-dependent oxidoreductase subunit E [Pseudomonadota bacterium]